MEVSVPESLDRAQAAESCWHGLVKVRAFLKAIDSVLTISAERYFGKYDLLCGDQNSVKWVSPSTGSQPQADGFTPIDGG
jgi:hypothetical protein